MNARSWFVLGTRLFGLYLLVQALTAALTAIGYRAQTLFPSSGVDPEWTWFMSFVVSAVGLGLAGAFLLVGADRLGRWLYPPGCCQACGHANSPGHAGACPECGERRSA